MSNKIKKRILPTIIILVLIAAIIIPAVKYFKTLDQDGNSIWEWNVLLNYYAVALTFFGTLALGYASYLINKRLTKLEEYSYVSNNSSSSVVEQIEFDLSKIVCNLKEHEEQILRTDDCETGNSLESIVYLKTLKDSRHACLVNVEKISLSFMLLHEKQQLVIDANNKDHSYTKVAMSENGDRFKLTILVSMKDREDIKKILNKSDVFIDIELYLSTITENKVKTRMHCRSILGSPDYSERKKCYSKFKKLENYEQLVFVDNITLADDEIRTKSDDSK